MSAEKIIEVALSQVGYLEKATNADLDSFTGNAGRNNYTKYGAWYGMNGEPWCDMFVSWCADQAGEYEAVGKFSYCPSHVQFFKGRGEWYATNGQKGDIIFFGDADHVGIVEYVSGGYVHTIEGNTSGASGLVANGGGVCRKSYSVNSNYIMGYGRPKYGTAKTYTEGWVQDSKGWWYRYTDGTWATGWKKIKGVWYYFDKESGYVATSQIVDGKYYVGAEGTLVTNHLLRTDGEGKIVPGDPWYDTLADVPQTYRKELDKLIKSGKFKGKGGSGESLIVDLPESAIRMLIICNR